VAGNLRQLRPFAPRRAVGWQRALADIEKNKAKPQEKAPAAAVPDSPARLKELERAMIEEALQRAGRNTSAAARDLGLPRSTLVNRMRSLGMV
jgi:DNA-binding NtrC family response regulator